MKKIILSMAAASALSFVATTASAQSNGVYIDQVSSESNLYVAQAGSSNRVGESTTARAQISGARNNVTIQQQGSNNFVARYFGVDGKGNNVNLVQSGSSNQVTYSSTIGSENNINLVQKGNSNKAVTWLRGDANSVNVESAGNSNSAEVAISGSKNSINRQWQQGRCQHLGLWQQHDDHAALICRTSEQPERRGDNAPAFRAILREC
jgi:hypothetical protein